MIGIRFERLFRGSVYVMVFLATLALSVDSTGDNPIAMAYPLLTLALSAWAYLKVDSGQVSGISRRRGNFLALLSIPLVIAEVRIGWRLLESDLLVLSLGHWLTYLLWIKIVMPKSVEDDWFIFLLGMVIILTSGVISQSDIVGELIFLWAIVSLWSLTLFYLEREAARAKNPSLRPNLPPECRIKTSDQPYVKLFDTPFLWSGIRVVLTTLILSVLVFLLMPRADRMKMSRRSGTVTRHLTGFDEEVKLGQLGEILENDAVFLTVEFFDSNGKAALPSEEPYWRGVTMSEYSRGQWKRHPFKPGSFPRNPSLEKTIRQKIHQEPTDSTILFGLSPIVRVRSLMRFRIPILRNGADGTIFRGNYNNAFDYEVYSSEESAQNKQIVSDFSEDELDDLTRVPGNILPDIRSMAAPIITNISESDTEARARALENHFFDSSVYAYTLEQTRIDSSVDPVIDFLKNRKEGHCEYYASALALMLRSVGIPSRLVNGFKGGDWNSLGQVMYVREKHAHAWVEALVRSGPDDEPYWITLDPTPANERRESIRNVGLLGMIRQASDYLNYIWVFYVIGFDAERQYRVLYEPIIALIQEARNGFLIIIQALKDLWTGTKRLSDLRKLFSLSGFVGGLTITVVAILFWQISRYFFRRFLLRLHSNNQKESSASEIAIYHRLESLLSELSLNRSYNETPREFARRVGIVLSDRFTEAGLNGIPDMVVDLFYQIRFGGAIIDSVRLDLMEERLNLLEQHIRQPT